MAGAVLLRKQYAPSDESGGRTAPHKPGHPPFIVLLLEVSAEGAPLVAFLGGLDGVSELTDLQRERPRVQWARADIPHLVRAPFRIWSRRRLRGWTDRPSKRQEHAAPDPDL